MEKKIVRTKNAPTPIGPYNQAVKAGGFVYVSGQIALHPVSADLHLDNIEQETKLVLENLRAVLEAANSDLDHVVKTSIFLSSMDLFQSVNAVYAQYFDSKNAPARECVAVSTLPKNVNVEISAIALERKK